MADQQQQNGSTGAAAFWWVGALLLGMLLRLWRVDAESPWFDEVLSLQFLDASTVAEFWRQLSAGDPPAVIAPVYFTVEYGWAALFGEHVTAVRGLSLVCGDFSIVLVYVLGRRLFSIRAGGIAALLFACALPHIYYAQEIRMYAWVTLLALLSLYTMVRAVDGGRSRWWMLHGVVNGLMLFSSIFSGTLLVVEGIWLWVQWRDHLRSWGYWCMVHGLLCVAVLGWQTWQYANAAFWMEQPTLRELVNCFVLFAGGRFSNENPQMYLPGGLSLEPVLLVLTALLAAWGIWRGCRGTQKTGTGLCVLWLAGPPVLLFLVAVLWKPCFLYRYVLFSSIALYLLVGVALDQIANRRVRWLLLTAVVAVLLYQNSLRWQGTFRPDYQALAAHIKKTETALENPVPMLVLKKKLNGLPLRYQPGITKDRMHYAYGEGSLYELSRDLVAAEGSVWVVMWRWDRREAYEQYLTDQGIAWRCTAFQGMPPLYAYQLGDVAGPVMR